MDRGRALLIVSSVKPDKGTGLESAEVLRTLYRRCAVVRRDETDAGCDNGVATLSIFPRDRPERAAGKHRSKQVDSKQRCGALGKMSVAEVGGLIAQCRVETPNCPTEL